MKKKTLPILMLIAGLSTAALAACGHEHKYEWKNSIDGMTHWQECKCGDKISEGSHVDADSNGKCDDCNADFETFVWSQSNDGLTHWQQGTGGTVKNEGAHSDTDADGACDDCSADVFGVTFDMHGHGVAPENLLILSGKKLIAPATPADDDAYKFKGWFKDSACTEPFDFENGIVTEATVLHAKWEEDTTAGASKKYAYELTLEQTNVQAVKSGVGIYFKFTATKEGRYTLSLGNGIYSQNATFTTSLTGDAVYGKDQSADSVTFDLRKNGTVYVLFTYLGEDGDDAEAGVLLGETVDEPLPEDRFLDGEYFDETYSLELNRTQKTIKYNGVAYNFKYIGGSFDRITFVQTLSNDVITFTLSHNSDGTYTFANDQKGTNAKVLKYAEPQNPIALNQITGYYEPKDGASDGITKLYIYKNDAQTSTSVVYKQNGVYYKGEANYNTEKNRLAFGQYTVTLVLDEDGTTVKNISVKGKLYVKKGEAGTLQELELPNNTEYWGESNTIRALYDSVYFGAEGYAAITVLGYSEGKYTVVVISGNAEKYYQLAVSDDKKKIELYNGNGALLDTLTQFEYVYHNLPSTETEVSLSASDFQKGHIYLYKATADGWYQFSNIPEGVQIYYNMNTNDPLFGGYPDGELVGGEAVNLTEGMIVGVYMGTPADTSFKVVPATAPAGWAEENPKTLTDGSATVSNIKANTTYYFKVTAPGAGNYLIRAYFDEGIGDNGDFAITFEVGGQQYSGSYSDKNVPSALFSATVGNLECMVTVKTSAWCSKQSITVALTEDYSAGATELILAGAPANDKLTLTATASAGNYYLKTTYGAAVTATGSAAFTVTLSSGKQIVAVETDGGFTAEIPAGEELYFRLISTAEVTFTQTFNKGDQAYPLDASAEEGSNTITVQTGEVVYFTLPAGDYQFSFSSDVSLMNGEAYVTTGEPVTVQAGDVLMLVYSTWGSGDPATLTIKTAQAMFNDEQIGAYKGSAGNANVTLMLDKFGFGSYTVKNGPYTLGGEIEITEENGVYTFTYSDKSDWFNPVDVTVTFTFVDGKLSVTDSSLNGGVAFELEKEVEEPVEESVTYLGKLGGENGYSVKLVIEGDKVTYYLDMGSGFEIDAAKATVTKNGNTYSFVNDYGDTHTFTISEDGNTVTFTDGYLKASGDLSKQG